MSITTTSPQNNQGNTCQTNAIADDKHGQNNAAQGNNNPQLPPSIKGRAASKLSSRHNRRKRRGSSGEERSAKKPRSKRNNTERVPIPSFAPIRGVVCDVKGTEVCASVEKKTHDALEDSKSKNNSSSDAIIINGSSNQTFKTTGEESQDKAMDESDPCNKGQVCLKLLEGQHKPMSDECQRKTEDCSTDASLVAKPLPKENNVLHQVKHIDIQEGKKEREIVNSLMVGDENDSKQVAVKVCTENHTLAAQVAKKPISTNNSSTETLKSSCFPQNEASSSPAAEHADKEFTNNNDGKGNVKKIKRSEYFDDTAKSEQSADNVIEILDDDDENDVGNGAAAKCDSVKSERPAKRSATTTAKKNDAPSKKKKPNTKSTTAGNQTKKKSTTRKRDQTSAKDVKSENCSNGVEQKKKKGKKLCFACSSCNCNTRSGTDATPQKLSALSGSDARQEQTLVNRLQRIERNIAWNEGQRNDVARTLKKHRGQMLKKYQSSNNDSSKNNRFLADVEVSDELGGLCSHNISSKEINRANNRIFGEGAQKSKFFGIIMYLYRWMHVSQHVFSLFLYTAHQPTLTQIIRGSKDGDDADNNNVVGNEAEKDTFKSEQTTTSPASQDDFLTFWGENQDPTRCLGSMGDFNIALVKFNGARSNGQWAKAAANSLQMENDEGFDALVELFDSSIGVKSSPGRCIHCSQNDSDDDDDNFTCMSPAGLTPRGNRIKKEIEASVTKDHNRMAAIERMAPNWKRDLDFAQGQTDPQDLEAALQNVRQAKIDLDAMKERILQAFLDRHQTLELYESALQSSIDRLSDKMDEE